MIIAAHRRAGRGPARASTATAIVEPPYVADCYLCPGNARVQRRAESDVRRASSCSTTICRACRKTRRATVTPPLGGVFRNRPAEGKARVVCYSPLHNTTLAELPVDRRSRAARLLAGAVSRAGRAAGSQPRADLREQGEGGRRLESASPLPDLRHEFRVQDDRERGRRVGPLLAGESPRAVRGHHRGRKGRRPTNHRRKRFGDRVRAVLRPLCVRNVRRAEAGASEHCRPVGRAS